MQFCMRLFILVFTLHRLCAFVRQFYRVEAERVGAAVTTDPGGGGTHLCTGPSSVRARPNLRTRLTYRVGRRDNGRRRGAVWWGRPLASAAAGERWGECGAGRKRWMIMKPESLRQVLLTQNERFGGINELLNTVAIECPCCIQQPVRDASVSHWDILITAIKRLVHKHKWY